MYLDRLMFYLLFFSIINIQSLSHLFWFQHRFWNSPLFSNTLPSYSKHQILSFTWSIVVAANVAFQNKSMVHTFWDKILDKFQVLSNWPYDKICILIISYMTVDDLPHFLSFALLILFHSNLKPDVLPQEQNMLFDVPVNLYNLCHWHGLLFLAFWWKLVIKETLMYQTLLCKTWPGYSFLVNCLYFIY